MTASLPVDVLQQARQLLRTGQAEAAIPRLAAVLNQKPTHHAALLLLGQCFESLRRFGEAVAVYERAMAVLPGHAVASTRRSLLLWRRDHGAPPSPRAEDPAKPVISCATLGSNGRFGNQLMQYAATRLLARVHCCEAQFPDWIGRDLFGCQESLVHAALPRRREAELDLERALSGPASSDYANIDLVGYFVQHSARLLAPHRRVFRDLFEPVGAARQRADSAEQRLRERGKTVVAIHLRRGDFGSYGSDQFWVAPEDWYRPWLEALWPQLERPVLYIASDDPGTVHAFRDYQPVCAQDLDDPQPGAEWLEDFFLLTRADALAISNSTFSAVAALLNQRCQVFARPDRGRQTLRAYDPWHSVITEA